MVVWYAAGAVLVVWLVFQSAGVDYRTVALGALLPLLVDLPFGEQRYGHTLVAAAGLLAVVMLATVGRGRRLARRRWLGLPIGMLCGLVLAGSWQHTALFWWPFGTEMPDGISLWPEMPWPVVLELAGLAIAAFVWSACGLGDPGRRRAFVRSGRLIPATAEP